MIVKIINIFIVVHLIKNNDEILITMKENNEIITSEQCEIQKKSLEDTIAKDSREEDIDLNAILQWLFYILGAVLIVMSVIKYNADLETYKDEFHFDEIGYVGGDAYNYIISAARSTAIMIKSLILALFGCTSIIAGLILSILNKK